MIDKTFEQLVHSLAAKTPTPGGGAAAALSACLGAALLQMVVRFARGKKANVDRDDDLARADSVLGGHLERLLPMAERDCTSFDHVSAAYALTKDTEEQKAIRHKAIQEAMVGAMVVPEEVLCMVRDVFVAVDDVVSCIGKAIVSDLATGAELLRAAAEGALLNVRINAAYLEDQTRAEAAYDRARAVRSEILNHHESITNRVDELL